MEKIELLTTESSNAATQNIDRVSTIEMVKMINDEDKKVALAIEKELPKIAEAIDQMTARYKNGGRIIYIGAGSSGRLGVMDAAELTPTYNVEHELAFGILAGGEGAMFTAAEGAEDSAEGAVKDLQNINLCEKDVVIGIAASGRTPYTTAACEYANQVGALSVGVTCNGNSKMAQVAQIAIAPVVGAEVITGSTRMKAGTAQKMVLNMLSTGVMIRVGKVYKNYMINVQPTNEKLVIRATNMLAEILNIEKEEARKKLEAAKMSVAIAILMHEKNVAYEAAKNALDAAQGNVSNAMENL